MPYSLRDVIGFPPPAPGEKTVDWQTLCDMVDKSNDYPVTYAFGGNAPTMIKLGGGMPLAVSTLVGYSRMFIEFSPYYWNPDSPDYAGGN